ncbi:sugar phosphate isomerase/epimerase family protein [Runella slithyformis]|uniref:Xylose isomerase domain-containing protein TIM barrel n=1 Tax=Runella slithyformis (strain ATCC 29530 / DSM 19594 / LMG 11500 / NCIMB 11436 / LSU 4) TaxID=761193 RepID=A0A7U4E923_RUNSL|nr:TIM barrel protein [Runella slithyformis]AEI52233.1 Xylose isomerase domain-containing protein TIM barrel [Runella slithyformis DSM 19594]
MTNRRSFLKNTVATIALAGPAAASVQASQPEAQASEDLFKLGIAGYSFVHFKLDQALEMMKKVDVHYLCIKDFHLPFNSTDEQIATFHATLKNSGVTGYAVGPIYMKTTQEIDNGFAYAKRVGVKLIVGVPNEDLLPYIDKKVKEYDMRYAIHIHGPDIKLWPNASSVIDAVKNLDARIGLCFDMGHDARFGDDPIADLEKYQKRIFDIHLKNVTAASKEGKTCELGRGIIDIPAFVAMLRKIKYTGSCSLEYEKDMKDPLAGIAESVGYFKGVCDASKSGKRKV